MLLNHLPITFSASQFAGYRLPYESGDQLKALRARFFKTHFVLRTGDAITLFPYAAGTATDGEAVTFDVGTDHGVANALAHQALLRSFFNHHRSISGVRPAKFVRDTANLLAGKGAETFIVFAEYAFNVRPLAPQDGGFLNGVLVNFGARPTPKH
ncbi:MAG TPA: hypothetical protein PK201_00925 [Accumulibacter sp.]|nr:hypothetical protein [Accumulibacter sp.]